MAKKKDELDDLAVIVAGPLIKSFTMLVESIEKVVATSEKFVQALNPGIIIVFNQALRDLQATIGQALVPLFEVLANTIREVSAIISPAMLALAPIFRQLAEIASKLIVAFATLFADRLQALVPILQILTDVFSVVVSVIRVLIAIFDIFTSILSPLIALISGSLSPALQFLSTAAEGIARIMETIAIIIKAFADALVVMINELTGILDIKDVINDMKDGINNVVRSLVLFAARLAASFGMTTVVDNLIKAFDKKAPGASAAPQNIQLQSFESITDDITKGAFGAQGGGGSKDEKDEAFKAELLGLLKEIRGAAINPPSLKEVGNEMVDLASWDRFKSGVDNIRNNGLSGAFEGSDFRAGLRKLGI